jgi:hypothetical protein
VAYGVGYFVSAIRGRREGWRELLRQTNLHLAVLTCAVAFILALPIFNFGAISASNQLARLESKAVSVQDFDYAALRWDFGDAGREALAELAASKDAEIAKLATDAQARETRPYGPGIEARRERAANAVVETSDTETEVAVREFLAEDGYRCGNACRVVEVGEVTPGKLLVLLDGGFPTYLVMERDTGKVQQYNFVAGRLQPEAPVTTKWNDLDAKVELKPFSGQQLYIDGEAVGQPFE